MQTLALEHIDELQLLLERDDELRTLPLQPPVVGHHAVVLRPDNVLALTLLRCVWGRGGGESHSRAGRMAAEGHSAGATNILTLTFGKVREERVVTEGHQ